MVKMKEGVMVVTMKADAVVDSHPVSLVLFVKSWMKFRIWLML